MINHDVELIKFKNVNVKIKSFDKHKMKSKFLTIKNIVYLLM